MSSDIRLNDGGRLTDHEIDPNYPAGMITNFGGEMDGYLWIIPASINEGPRMYTADNLRQIAEILDAADDVKEK